MQSDSRDWFYPSTSCSSDQEVYLPVHTGSVSEHSQLSLCAHSPDGSTEVIGLTFAPVNYMSHNTVAICINLPQLSIVRKKEETGKKRRSPERTTSTRSPSRMSLAFLTSWRMLFVDVSCLNRRILS